MPKKTTKPRALKLNLKPQNLKERIKVYNALYWYWQQAPSWNSAAAKHKKTMRSIVNLAAAAAGKPVIEEA